MIDYSFHWGPVWKAMPALLKGAQITLEITVLSMIIGTILAVFLALGRQSKNKTVYGLVTGWVELARNTPSLFQMYMAYFGLGTIGLHLDSYTAVLSALAFNNAGYLAEVLRGGFNAVPKTQMAAARSLGMNPFQAYSRVILPQVFRVVFYPATNQMMWALLNSSLGMIVGLKELTGATAFQQSLTFRSFEFFFAAAVMYYVIAKIVTMGARLAARRLFRG